MKLIVFKIVLIRLVFMIDPKANTEPQITSKPTDFLDAVFKY